jgi:uncharacterized protein
VCSGRKLGALITGAGVGGLAFFLTASAVIGRYRRRGGADLCPGGRIRHTHPTQRWRTGAAGIGTGHAGGWSGGGNSSWGGGGGGGFSSGGGGDFGGGGASGNW